MLKNVYFLDRTIKVATAPDAPRTTEPFLPPAAEDSVPRPILIQLYCIWKLSDDYAVQQIIWLDLADIFKVEE